MRMMGAKEIFFITINQNVSFTGKTWWILMLVFRLPVLLLAGFTLFSDEQDRFNCNTMQPGCSNVCFDLFAPVSVLRLWLFHLTLLGLPHLMFATYIMHKVLSCPYFGEPSSHKALLHDLPLGRSCVGAPRFYGAYFVVIILRILLEAIFSAAQFFLFGLSIPKSFLCYEAPCTSGVECYISRPTEKNFMLNFMLCVAFLSVLLSLVDLVNSVKAMLRWRRKREMLTEEISNREQNSMFTVATVTEDTNILLTRRSSPSGSSKVNGLRDEKPADGVVPNSGLFQTKASVGTTVRTSAANDKKPENTDGKEVKPRSPTSTSVSSHVAPQHHLKPPLLSQTDKGSPTNPRATTPIRQCRNDGSQDKRAWV
ncbi:gap junction delta-4 protein-like [Neolamprologus brichardi]|uniref:gap junction delta-4 protein-like n=1 Tax=Neolamprologus brichardi TaxID=32507 RepID=UPI001643AF55|nr:gap junction delta-4 protein-like [Neolamprologus brichardi]